MKYKQITVSTSHGFSDIVSYFLCEAGSEGVSVYDAAEFRATLDEFSWDYVDGDFLKDASAAVLVSGYFDEGFDEGLIEAGISGLRESGDGAGSLEISCKVIDSADWENVWMQFYKPMEIGKIAVVPKWLKNPFENALPVYINPGMAFGTGSHETTSMCIELMQDCALEGLRVADVGCGSGILGLCALRLGAESCTFVDCDPVAVKAAKENCGYNGLEQKCNITEGSLLCGGDDKYDFILANLTADILLSLYPMLENGLRAGGEIVISGIIGTRLDEVTAVYYGAFDLARLESRNDWRALRLRKK